MRTPILLLTIIASLLTASGALGGAHQIYVSESVQNCVPQDLDPEIVAIKTDLQGIEKALSQHFKGELSGEMQSGIVNAGIQFCSQAERTKVFTFMLEALKSPAPSKNTFQVIKQYKRTKTMRGLVESYLKQTDLDETFRKNLQKIN